MPPARRAHRALAARFAGFRAKPSPPRNSRAGTSRADMVNAIYGYAQVYSTLHIS